MQARIQSHEEHGELAASPIAHGTSVPGAPPASSPCLHVDGMPPGLPERDHDLDGTSPATPGCGRDLDGTSPAMPGRGRDLGEGERAWAIAVAFTRGKSPASFDQWFSGVQFDDLTDGVLSLRARDEFVRQWVEDYFLPTLGDRLRAQTGLSIQVRWSIDGLLDRPVADRPATFTPVRPRALSVRPGSTDDASSSGQAGAHRLVVHTQPAATRVLAVASPIEGLNTKYTFANFVVGPSNQLAHAASMAAGGAGGRRHSPLFICGGTGPTPASSTSAPRSSCTSSCKH